jgi:uncharacterized lipoprotein YajG
MKTFFRLTVAGLFAAALLVLPSCDRPQDTLNALQTEVSAYASNPSDEAAAKIDENFTRLDAQIAKLREGGDVAGANALAKQRDALQAQYAAARMTASLLKAKEAAASVGEAFRKAGEAFGEALKGQPENND